MILDAMDKLTEQEPQEVYKKLQSVLDYNYNHFHNKANWNKKLEDGFNINTNYNFIGSHLDIHNSNYSTISMSDVHLLDLSLTKNFYGIEVGFSINNLLDESFQAPHGFSQDGRNLSFVFKSSF